MGYELAMANSTSGGYGNRIDQDLIESAAKRHPLVATAAVTSLPDPFSGEMPVLYVVIESGWTCLPEEIAWHLSAIINDPSALPRFVFVVDEIPTTAAGTIDRDLLRHDANVRAARSALMALAAFANSWMEVEIHDVPPGIKVTVLSAKATQTHLRTRSP